jgi:hypothetical protein
MSLSIPPDTWGPFFWHTFHLVALGYTNDPSYSDKKAAKDFFESMTFLIPCPQCREHYKVFLKELPITPHLDAGKDLFRWTVVLHNRVNKSLGKQQFTESESKAFYSRLGKRGRSPVITAKDFAEADNSAYLKGLIGGLAIGGILVGTFYLSEGKIKFQNPF